MNEPIPGATSLDGPIPGQSLTDEPGKMPWDSPPDYTNVEKALDYILTTITRDQQMRELLVMIHQKVPLEAIARVILFTGFSKGKWTFDLMALMQKPVLQMLVAIAKAADLDFELAMPYHKQKDDWQALVQKIVPMTGEDSEEEAPPSVVPPAGMGGMSMGAGLMSPKGMQ